MYFLLLTNDLYQILLKEDTRIYMRLSVFNSKKLRRYIALNGLYPRLDSDNI